MSCFRSWLVRKMRWGALVVWWIVVSKQRSEHGAGLSGVDRRNPQPLTLLLKKARKDRGIERGLFGLMTWVPYSLTIWRFNSCGPMESDRMISHRSSFPVSRPHRWRHSSVIEADTVALQNPQGLLCPTILRPTCMAPFAVEIVPSHCVDGPRLWRASRS